MGEYPMLCMFCADEIAPDDLSMEHFVPKCLWEKKSRPEHIRTVPAHKACNNSFSDDNEYFRTVLVLEEGATERCEAARKVGGGAIRRMFQSRFGTLVKAAKNLGERPVQTKAGIFIGNRPIYEIDWPRMQRVLFNVMAGIYYTVEKKPMPPGFILDVADVQDVQLASYERMISSMVDWQGFGDDAFLCRYSFLRREQTRWVASCSSTEIARSSAWLSRRSSQQNRSRTCLCLPAQVQRFSFRHGL
jgi:hypothetical protein